MTPVQAWISIGVGVAFFLIVGWLMVFELGRATRSDLRGGLLGVCSACLVTGAWALSYGIGLFLGAKP